MRLSRKQEKAISVACDTMSTILSSGLDSDEDESITEAINVLLDMKLKSIRENIRYKSQEINFHLVSVTGEIIYEMQRVFVLYMGLPWMDVYES